MGGLLHGPFSSPYSLTIDGSHQNVHDGYMFEVSGRYSLGSAEVLEIALTVPAGVYPHAIFDVASEKIAVMTVIEGVTSLSGGAAMTEFNQNRNSSVTTTVAATLGTPASAITYSGGTTIRTRQLTTSATLAAAGFAGEVILKTNAVTVVRLVAGAASCDASICVRWYQSPR